jgi:hypothetical protein
MAIILRKAYAHCFDADLDMNFHFDADLNPDPDWQIKTKPVHPICMRILPEVLRILEYRENVFYFYSQLRQFTMFFFSHQRQLCHDFSILDKCSRKNKKYMCLELIPIQIGRIWIGMPWILIRIQIWQNDADPT